MITGIKNRIAFKLINLGISMLDRGNRNKDFILNCIITGHIVLDKREHNND